MRAYEKIGKGQCGRILAGVGLAAANTIRFLLSAVVVMVLQYENSQAHAFDFHRPDLARSDAAERAGFSLGQAGGRIVDRADRRNSGEGF
jgi:hypothetical protein